MTIQLSLIDFSCARVCTEANALR